MTAAWLIQNAVVATAMALVLVVVVRWAKPRPALEHLLWLVVAAKFVLPPLAVFAVPASLPPMLSAMPGFVAAWGGGADERALAASAADDARAAEAVAPLAPPARGAGVPADAPLAPGADAGGAGAVFDWPLPFSASSLLQWLLIAWLGFALAAGCWRLLRHGLWLRRVERESEAPPEALNAAVGEGARTLGLRAPRVVVSAAVTSPLVTGLREPVLYWPRELLGVLTPERTRTIVVHELAHLRRRDLWSGVLEFVVDCVWRWYPGWRVVRRRMRDAAERACDLVVVQADPSSRREYAEAILDVLALDVRRRRDALALGVDGPGPVEQRIEHILHPPSTSGGRAHGHAAVALVALALVPAWTRGASVSEEHAAVEDAAVERAVVDGTAVERAAGQPPAEIATEPRPSEPAAGEAQREIAQADVAAVVSRGVVAWRGGAAPPELEPDGWLIAFSASGDVTRRLEMRRQGGAPPTVRYLIDRREARFDGGAASWLSEVFERTHYRPGATEPTKRSSSSSVPHATHLHYTGNHESLAFWSTREGGIQPGGTLEASADAQHPVYMVHQRADGGPVEFVALARDGDGIRVLERSLDATPASRDDEAEALSQRRLVQLAQWTFSRSRR